MPDFSAQVAQGSSQRFHYIGSADSGGQVLSIGNVAQTVVVTNTGVSGDASVIVNYGAGADVTIAVGASNTYTGAGVTQVKIRTASGMGSVSILATRTVYTAKRSNVQRVVTVAAVSTTAVLAATTMPTSGTTLVQASITNPDEYRCLRIIGNTATCLGNVVIEGTNWNDEYITETIALNGSTAVNGVKPFKTVTSVLLPVRGAASDTVSVGYCDVLGLHFTIGATTDVLQVARKASAATAYTIEATGTVDATNMTVVQGTAITAADSFEITYLTRVA